MFISPHVALLAKTSDTTDQLQQMIFHELYFLTDLGKASSE